MRSLLPLPRFAIASVSCTLLVITIVFTISLLPLDANRGDYEGMAYVLFYVAIPSSPSPPGLHRLFRAAWKRRGMLPAIAAIILNTSPLCLL
ncbi:MAG TPA: hypothetical protein VF618_27060 [Thermoanaerobaculia bacterium]